MTNQLERDRALIKQLGGPAKVAELLNWPKYGGVQRVQNWMSRGIPAQVKVDHPQIFMGQALALTQPAEAAPQPQGA